MSQRGSSLLEVVRGRDERGRVDLFAPQVAPPAPCPAPARRWLRGADRATKVSLSAHFEIHVRRTPFHDEVRRSWYRQYDMAQDAVQSDGLSGRSRLAWVTFAARLAVGAVFVLAGVTKLINPGSFSATLLAYDVLPVGLLRPVALALPWLELVVGLYLLAGLFTRVAAWGAVAMLAVFMAAITQALLRGLSLEDCGCFGDITSAVPALQYVLGGSTLGAMDVLRDAVYAALALLVALGPATPLSIDGLLTAQRSASAGAAAGAESRPERALERRKEPDALRHRRRAGHEADPGEDQHQQQHHAEVGEQGQQRSRGALLALAPRLCLPRGTGTTVRSPSGPPPHHESRAAGAPSAARADPQPPAPPCGRRGPRDDRISGPGCALSCAQQALTAGP